MAGGHAQPSRWRFTGDRLVLHRGLSPADPVRSRAIPGKASAPTSRRPCRLGRTKRGNVSAGWRSAFVPSRTGGRSPCRRTVAPRRRPFCPSGAAASRRSGADTHSVDSIDHNAGIGRRTLGGSALPVDLIGQNAHADSSEAFSWSVIVDHVDRQGLVDPRTWRGEISLRQPRDAGGPADRPDREADRSPPLRQLGNGAGDGSVAGAPQPDAPLPPAGPRAPARPRP
jgi:hypothetical protein